MCIYVSKGCKTVNWNVLNKSNITATRLEYVGVQLSDQIILMLRVSCL